MCDEAPNSDPKLSELPSRWGPHPPFTCKLPIWNKRVGKSTWHPHAHQLQSCNYNFTRSALFLQKTTISWENNPEIIISQGLQYFFRKLQYLENVSTITQQIVTEKQNSCYTQYPNAINMYCWKNV